jgi:hypothetical protein
MSNPAASDQRVHIFDAVAAERKKVVGGFAEQRQQLKKSVEQQRIAAMPEDMRRAALAQLQGQLTPTTLEIVRALREIIREEVAKEVSRQLVGLVQAAGLKSSSAPPAGDHGLARPDIAAQGTPSIPPTPIPDVPIPDVAIPDVPIPDVPIPNVLMPQFPDIAVPEAARSHPSPGPSVPGARGHGAPETVRDALDDLAASQTGTVDQALATMAADKGGSVADALAQIAPRQSVQNQSAQNPSA